MDLRAAMDSWVALEAVEAWEHHRVSFGGGMRAPRSVFGGGMGVMGLGGFGGGYGGMSMPMGEAGGKGAPPGVYGAMGGMRAPPGGFMASMVSPVPPSSDDAYRD
jgi:hypothetical protein